MPHIIVCNYAQNNAQKDHLFVYVEAVVLGGLFALWFGFPLVLSINMSVSA